MNSAMTRRATSVSMDSSAGRTKGGCWWWSRPALVARRRIARRAPTRELLRGHVQARHRAGFGRAVGGSPARSRTSRRHCGRPAPGARPAAAAGRSARAARRPGRRRRRTGPRRTGGAEDGRSGRRDDLRAAPEGDRLVDAHAIAEHHEGRRQLCVRAHERPPRGRRPETHLVRGRRSRPATTTLINSWAPSSASTWATDRCQKSSHTARPTPTPSRDGTGTRYRRREEAPLVEEAVRQVELAVDVPDAAVLEQRRGDEQPMVGRLLDERHDRRQPGRVAHERGQARIVEPHRHLGREVLELVASQPELGEHDQPGTASACLGDERAVTLEVLLEHTQARRQLAAMRSSCTGRVYRRAEHVPARGVATNPRCYPRAPAGRVAVRKVAPRPGRCKGRRVRRARGPEERQSMTRSSRSWSLPALLASVAIVVSACAGATTSPSASTAASAPAESSAPPASAEPFEGMVYPDRCRALRAGRSPDAHTPAYSGQIEKTLHSTPRRSSSACARRTRPSFEDRLHLAGHQ